jgi:poly(3-hydroxyalkanoate) synthetase
LFAAQADFSEPGELAYFINASQLAMLEATMYKLDSAKFSAPLVGFFDQPQG